MPANYDYIDTKKFLDAAGLTYFCRLLNRYPTNDVLEAVIDGVQDALGEKLNIVECVDYSLFPFTGADETLYIDTTSNSIYRWNGSSYVNLNEKVYPAAITNAEIDALFS